VTYVEVLRRRLASGSDGNHLQADIYPGTTGVLGTAMFGVQSAPCDSRVANFGFTCTTVAGSSRLKYLAGDAANNKSLVQCPNLNHASSWAI